jgi:aspartokinase/homoserine dehydrogenase 1
MKVLKFMELVANAQNIKLVLDIVQEQDQLIVVVSALSKVTDLLHLGFIKSRFN